MSKICPVCNGLYDQQVICSNCGTVMEQAGRPEDYVEPYGPYMEKGTLLNTSSTQGNCCIHLYTCPNCNHLEQSAVQIVSI